MSAASGTSAEAATVAEPAEATRSRSAVWRWIVGIWKALLGAVFCQNPIGGLIAAGWTQRLVQRSAIKQLWKLSPDTDRAEKFGDWIESTAAHDAHRHFPNWILAQNYRDAARRRPDESAWRWLLRTPVELVRSLATNLALGFKVAATTWVLTLPACSLWAFAWYSGWNNSFHKGYEHAVFGPSTFILGIALFTAAMLYVPFAQARQAVTGNWRSFFGFRLVWGISRRNALSTLLLAAAYSALGFFVMIMKSMPEFFPQMNPALETLTHAEAKEILATYFFWTALPVLGFFILLRTWAGRIYTRGLVEGVRSGRIDPAQLDPAERSLLDEFDLLEPESGKQHNVIIRAAVAGTSFAARATLMTATVLVWLTFSFSILVSEFINYQSLHGWLNQPLVHIPWFNYTPSEPKPLESDIFR